MTFGLISWVGRGMGVLDGVMIVEEDKGPVLDVNVGHPIVTNGDGDALFPNCDLLPNNRRNVMNREEAFTSH